MYEVTENDDGTLTITVTDVSGGYIARARDGFDDVLIGHDGQDTLLGSDGDNELIAGTEMIGLRVHWLLQMIIEF